MSKKIKSITTETGETFNLEDWELTLQEDGYIQAKFKGKSKQTVWYPKDTLVIEYESKILKRSDGSLISGLKNGQEVIRLFYSQNGYKSNADIFYFDPDLTALKLGLIFLPEDKDLAEKKAKMFTKQLDIKYEIERLNAEQGWVADWNSTQEKYILENRLKVCSKVVTYNNSGQTPMSEKTAETILAKYTQDELKQYLGIIC